MITFADMLARTNGPAVGTWVKLPSVESLEVLKIAGFDFVVIDSEHAPLTLREIDTLIVLARALDMPPIVRVPDHGYSDVQRLLDAGCAGVLVPHVANGVEARQVISQMVHPPRGRRGAGNGMRAGDWLMTEQGKRAYADPSRVWRVAMIEDFDAVDCIDEILMTPDLSAVFVGWGDLSMALGTGSSDPRVGAAMNTVLTRAKASGVPVATTASDAADIVRLAEAGYDFIMAGNDIGLLGLGARQMLSSVTTLRTT